MECSGSALKQSDVPSVVMLCGDHCLNRVDCRIDVRLSRRHHAGDGAKNGDFSSQKSYFSDLPYERGGLMIAKDLREGRFDLPPSVELAAIETDDMTILSEKCGKISGTAFVPAAQQVLIEVSDRNFIGGHRIHSHSLGSTVQQYRFALAEPLGFVGCGDGSEIAWRGSGIIHPLAQQLASVD